MKDFLCLLLLYFMSNPVNGYALVDLNAFSKETKTKKDYLRIIFKKLKDLQLIYYKDRKGSGKNFKVYCGNLIKTNHSLNDLAEIKKYYEDNMNYNTDIQPDIQLSSQIHNFDDKNNYSNISEVMDFIDNVDLKK